MDTSGSVLEVEREVAAGKLPTAVSDAIARAANGGKFGKIKSVTRGGVIACYETTIPERGRRRGVALNPQGATVNSD